MSRKRGRLQVMARWLAAGLLLCLSSVSLADEDKRILVELPERMQQHMMANMRDHLETINRMLELMADEQLEAAGELAEQRLGMSSLAAHGAEHMGRFMPEGMRKAGMEMHRAASRFAVVAQEGDLALGYKTLPEITAACTGCHAGYRIR
ncbi:MAG: hypothetical protein ABW101_19570 [Candidatus Thiodiazotropha sp.]